MKDIFISLLIIGSYWIFYRKYKKRDVTELSFNKNGKKLLAGILARGGLQSLTILVIYLYGGFEVINVNPVSILLIPFTVAFTIAII